MEAFAQAIGLVGMLFNLLAYQQKTQKNVLICQFFAALTFGVNYLLLGAVIGGLLNFTGAVRAAVFYFEKKTHANSLPWLIVFVTAFAASYPLTFLVFGTPPSVKNLIIELLPVLSMILATFSLRLGSAKAVRSFGLICSPLWLIYNCFSGSIGAIASEILNLSSIFVGIYRLDRKGNLAEQEAKKPDT